MRALKYFVTEAAASLWRGRRSAILAILTIGAGLFVLGFFLIVNTNVRRLTERWGESAEFAVYLRDDITKPQLEAVQSLIDSSGLSAARQYVSKEQAADRFGKDFPDLGATAGKLSRNPFPASVDVRLRPEVRTAEEAVDTLAKTLSSQPGVTDVRYDRRWLTRLNGVITFVRSIGLVIVALLALASALTVANVVRLAAHARRDEIEIMQLVGAPLAYVRGPLVLEGVMQGGAGAIVAIVALGLLFSVARARYGAAVADAVGLGAITFLPVELWIILLLGGMLLGSVGGLIVARSVR
ncbi:MAG TPA: ABC transporter permease [Vicinamibacterales bacterium]|nr:ABC transporter permease [Vicinamibacterales bacterium]